MTLTTPLITSDRRPDRFGFDGDGRSTQCGHLGSRPPGRRGGGKGRKRWTNRWKAALNAFDITFDGRLSAGRK